MRGELSLGKRDVIDVILDPDAQSIADKEVGIKCHGQAVSPPELLPPNALKAGKASPSKSPESKFILVISIDTGENKQLPPQEKGLSNALQILAENHIRSVSAFPLDSEVDLLVPSLQVSHLIGDVGDLRAQRGSSNPLEIRSWVKGERSKALLHVRSGHKSHLRFKVSLNRLVFSVGVEKVGCPGDLYGTVSPGVLTHTGTPGPNDEGLSTEMVEEDEPRVEGSRPIVIAAPTRLQIGHHTAYVGSPEDSFDSTDGVVASGFWSRLLGLGIEEA